jgi:hypothetical protein
MSKPNFLFDADPEPEAEFTEVVQAPLIPKRPLEDWSDAARGALQEAIPTNVLQVLEEQNDDEDEDLDAGVVLLDAVPELEAEFTEVVQVPLIPERPLEDWSDVARGEDVDAGVENDGQE